MLPRIASEGIIDKVYYAFLSALKCSAFSGEIRSDYAARLAVATDNSIYQVVPQAVIFPKHTHDISIALQLGQQKAFHTIQFVPRGGGTGTNGQSLSAGIVIDCSRFMCNILEINLTENWVRVEAGVVLDQLNVFLKSKGRYFAPQISPSNRATLGGMINTDACGNGSKTLGRTSDYVIDLTCILSDGQVIHTRDHKHNQQLCQSLTTLLTPKHTIIQKKFRQRTRNFNGYNLLKTGTTEINLNYLLCGSEGSLAVVSEAVLKILPIPAHKALILIKYPTFSDALRSHDWLDKIKPSAIEAIDEKLVALAREDPLYFQIHEMLDGSVKAGAINLVECVAETADALNESITQLCSIIEKNMITPHNTETSRVLGFYIAKNDSEIQLLWELRKKSVGLISKKQQGTRRPIPFIEDTAVDPNQLADYIAAFKQLLDQHQLIYGMYGHVDAGCVHVRPALDLKQSADEEWDDKYS